MSRPIKKGLDYFPMDTDIFSEPKIMDLINEFGPSGLTVYEYLLTAVYKEGYYLAIPLDKLVILAVHTIGAKWVKKDFVRKVILYCAEIGLFDNGLLRQNVITSVGIQRRYAKVTVRNKVDKTKFWLLDGEPLESVPENGVIVTETGVIVTKTLENEAKTPINKRKEKEKEKKEFSFDAEKADEEAKRSPVDFADRKNKPRRRSLK